MVSDRPLVLASRFGQYQCSDGEAQYERPIFVARDKHCVAASGTGIQPSVSGEALKTALGGFPPCGLAASRWALSPTPRSEGTSRACKHWHNGNSVTRSETGGWSPSGLGGGIPTYA